MAAKPCQEPGCERPKQAPFHRCYWHRLLTLGIDDQVDLAVERERQARAKPDFVERARVGQAEWPDGKRWCAGCQWFIPVFYTQGSRCKACASKSSYSSHLKATYGISYEDYQAMRDYQGGRCYICRRLPGKRRLAIDHDHKTGEVRGLLCADSERGCNHAILGNITSVEMAQRIVDYLVDPPFKAVRRSGNAPPPPTAELPDKPNDPAETKVRAAEPSSESPWNDGVTVSTVDIMRAHGAGQGIDAAGKRVPKGSPTDLTTWPQPEAPPRTAVRPPADRAALDAEWDALVL